MYVSFLLINSGETPIKYNNSHTQNTDYNRQQRPNPISIGEMKSIILNDISGCFESVYGGYSWAALSGCERLLTTSQRHIYMFLQLIEWAEGDKSLSAYGIKNDYIKRTKIKTDNNSTGSLNDKINDNMNDILSVGIDCYLVAIKKLNYAMSFKAPTKDILQQVQLCLASLKHIREIVCMAHTPSNDNQPNTKETKIFNESKTSNTDLNVNNAKRENILEIQSNNVFDFNEETNNNVIELQNGKTQLTDNNTNEP